MTTSNLIMFGDCRQLSPALEDKSIDCVITDPPYGVNYRSRSAVTAEGKKWVQEIANDADLTGAINLFHEAMAPIVKDKMKDNSDLYVFTRWDIVGEWIKAVEYLPGIKYKMLLVWDKGSPGMGDIDANWGCGHELILYCKKGRRDVSYRRSGIISIERVPKTQIVHPTEKPVALLETFIEMSTKPGDTVLDLFSGSGSTSVAAKNTGRNSYAYEVDKDFYERSMARLEQGVLF